MMPQHGFDDCLLNSQKGLALFHYGVVHIFKSIVWTNCLHGIILNLQNNFPLYSPLKFVMQKN